MTKVLRPQHQAFCDAYRGNATQAAIDAGYSPKTAGQQGYRLLKDVDIRAEIERQARARSRAAILTREQLQKMWSAWANDAAMAPRDRMRATELLGKSRGEFSEKLEVKGELSVTDLVRESYDKSEG